MRRNNVFGFILFIASVVASMLIYLRGGFLE
jgi:hypothetical protein